MKISNAKVRSVVRAIHLMGLFPIGMVIYTSPDTLELLLRIVRFAGFPAMLVTGLIMWKLPQLTKWLRREAKKPRIKPKSRPKFAAK